MSFTFSNNWICKLITKYTAGVTMKLSSTALHCYNECVFYTFPNNWTMNIYTDIIKYTAGVTMKFFHVFTLLKIEYAYWCYKIYSWTVTTNVSLDSTQQLCLQIAICHKIKGLDLNKDVKCTWMQSFDSSLCNISSSILILLVLEIFCPGLTKLVKIWLV